MNERNEFVCEMLLRALLSRINDQSDLLNVLTQGIGRTEEGIGHLSGEVETLKIETKGISKKIDTILQKLDDLENAFSDLKEESRSVDQKLVLMARKLDKIESNIQSEELEDYYTLCSSLYDNWSELEDLTRKLIPVAEYLFSSLQKYKKPDFSPVILELCRGIEAEFLMKIFSKYTIDLVNRKGRNLSQFLSVDSASSFLKSKTGQFVKAIRKHSKGCRPEYTLGQMNMIMSLMNDNQTVGVSPLLQDFKNYLERTTISNDLLNTQYIEKINDLVHKYRNPSAHPGFMPMGMAKECKDIMPERLDYLMDCIR